MRKNLSIIVNVIFTILVACVSFLELNNVWRIIILGVLLILWILFDYFENKLLTWICYKWGRDLEDTTSPRYCYDCFFAKIVPETKKLLDIETEFLSLTNQVNATNTKQLLERISYDKCFLYDTWSKLIMNIYSRYTTPKSLDDCSAPVFLKPIIKVIDSSIPSERKNYIDLKYFVNIINLLTTFKERNNKWMMKEYEDFAELEKYLKHINAAIG